MKLQEDSDLEPEEKDMPKLPKLKKYLHTKIWSSYSCRYTTQAS